MATLSKAKDHFKHDLLSGYQIVLGDASVMVRLEYQSGTTDMLDDARDKLPRQFKTIDAAVRSVQEIGFPVAALFSPR